MLSLVLVTWAALTPSAHATSPRNLVMLAPKSATRDATEAADAIKSHLSDVRTELTIVWVEELDVGSERAFRLAEETAQSRLAEVVFWTDYRDPRVLFWYWRDGAVGRLFVQSLGDDAMSRVARTEALGIAVRGAMGGTSALAGSSTARELAPPVPSEPAAATVATTKETAHENAMAHHASVGVAAGASTFTTQTLVTPTLEVDASVPISSGFAAVVAARWALPQSVTSPYGTLTMQTVSLRLGVEHVWELGDYALSCGAAFAAGYRRWSFADNSTGAFQQVGESRWLVGATPFAGAGYHLTERIQAVLRVGADVWPNEKQYGVSVGATQRVIAEPWWIAPWIQLGASVDFL